MKQLQNNFTTPEQSKRLLELGLPADSADCCLRRILTDGGYCETWRIDVFDFIGQIHDDYLPCWSVGRLIEIDNICSIPKIKEAGFHLLAQDFDDLIETMIISIKMKVEHNWIEFSKLED